MAVALKKRGKRSAKLIPNRCVVCNKFKPWDELRLTRYVPDTHFNKEISEYTCLTCRPELEHNL